jgi:Flp pilus assembly pilin Flp
MNKPRNRTRRLDAQGLVEYGLMLVLVMVVVVLVVTLTGDKIATMFSYISSTVVALLP